MRKLLHAAVAAAAGLSLTVAGADSAHATTNVCQPVSFSPSTIVLGESPITTTFDVTTHSPDCDSEGWHLTIAALDIDVADGSGLRRQSHTFFPDDFMDDGNTLTPGTYTAHVEQLDGDFDSYQADFAFHLKSATTWGSSFNAGPEPAHKGAAVHLSGKLSRALWGFPHGYHGYPNRHVAVQFAPAGSSAFTKVEQVQLGSSGVLSATVTASKSGTWRMFYGGNAGAGGAYSNADYVAVT